MCIITENQFRAAQAKLFLPTLLERIQAVEGSASIAIGCGKVPPLSPEEIADKLGPEVMSKGVPVQCNDVSNPRQLRVHGHHLGGDPPVGAQSGGRGRRDHNHQHPPRPPCGAMAARA